MPDDLHRVLADLLSYEHWWRGTEAHDEAGQAAAGVVLRKGHRVLFVRHGGRGTWEFPGGTIEPDETPEAAAEREANEEIGAPAGMTLTPLWKSQDDTTIPYSLFVADVDGDFRPELVDGELDDWLWASPESPPDPLHPGIDDALARLIDGQAMDEEAIAQDAQLAFDRSVRTIDKNGYLHVSVSPISKAMINEYFGYEIVDGDKIGLDPEHRYRLYRDPDELAKAVATFNNLPILIRHQPVSADAHPKPLTVGTTGTDARFEAPYLLNSLTIWDQEAIDGIETDERKQLSAAYRYRADMKPGSVAAAYRYRADMTPGSVNGQRYDGVMRDIAGNHVALVAEGRAGADVVVGDSQPQENDMPAARTTAPQLSRQALFLSAACIAYTKPKLAADQKMPDLRVLLKGVTSKSWKDKRATFETAYAAAVKPRLAADASLADFHDFLDGFSAPPAEGELLDPEMEPKGTGDAEAFGGEETPGEELLEQGTSAGKLMQYLQSVLTPEEMAQAQAIASEGGGEETPPPAEGEQPPPPKPEGEDQGNPEDDDMRRRREESETPPPVTKQAMDAAIAAAVKAADDRNAAKRDAENAVRPFVGEIAVAMDSADAVYRFALKSLGVNVEGVHPSALRTILDMQPKPSERRQKDATNTVALDAAERKSFQERFPNFGRRLKVA